MVMRKAVESDAPFITELVRQLDYDLPEEIIREKIIYFHGLDNELLLVCEEEGRAAGFISVHFIPQIALKSDFARISYFCVDKNLRSRGTGSGMERYVEELARKRGCDRIELHSHFRRTDAHRFYLDRGYIEYPKYFIKKLDGNI